MSRTGKLLNVVFCAAAQRPDQDSLDWARSGSSKGQPQGSSPEGDADVRVVSEDKTHRVRSLSDPAFMTAAPHKSSTPAFMSLN